MYGTKMFDPFLFDLLRRERVQNPGHKMVAGAKYLRDRVIFVILARVSGTSRKGRLANDTCPESSATELYP
jgi:hypothetical protein